MRGEGGGGRGTHTAGTRPYLERFARAFLIQPHEVRPVFYHLGLFMLLGAGMALGRGTADALFFKRYGIDNLPFIYVLSALALAASCTLYASFADRLSSERLFRYILGVLGALLLLVWSLMQLTDSDWPYPLYYVVYEVASELVLIHAGLYLNQNLDALQAKRLVPLIFGGSQVGVIAGGLLLAGLSPLIGVGNVVLLWALAAVLAIVLVSRWHRRRGMSPYFKPGRKRRLSLAASLGEVFQGARLIRHSPLLRMASFSLFFMVIVFYVLIYSVNQVYTDTFKSEEALSSFFGMLVAVNSFIALIFQFFIANRVLRRYGVRTVNLFFPVTSLLTYLGMLLSFSLPTALLGSFNKDVVMPAFRNPVWSLMMNALPGNVQGRARAMTVALVIPLALLTAGLTLMAVKQWQSPVYVVLVGLISAMLYWHYSWRMNRVYAAEIVASLKQKLTLPADDDGMTLRGGDEQVLQALVRGVEHADDGICLAHARPLVQAFPEQATDILVPRLARASDKAQDQLIRLLLPLRAPQLAGALWQRIGQMDERLQSTCYYGLILLRDAAIRDQVPGLLRHQQARFRYIGVLGAYALNMSALQAEAHTVWAGLLAAPEPLSNAFGLELLELAETLSLPVDRSGLDVALAVRQLLQQRGEVHGCVVGLRHAHCLAAGEPAWLAAQLQQLVGHEHRKVRLAALRASLALPEAVATLQAALEDPHPQVRAAAAALLNQLAGHSSQAKSDRLTGGGAGSPRAQSAIMALLLQDNAEQTLLAALAQAKAEEAGLLNEALQRLRQLPPDQAEQPAIRTLQLVLADRLAGTIDLSLLALQKGDDADSVGAIRLGMQSHELQYRAKACEAVHGLANRHVGRLLAAVLEAPDTIRQSRFGSLHEVIAWCLGRNDPWLQQCAAAVHHPAH